MRRTLFGAGVLGIVTVGPTIAQAAEREGDSQRGKALYDSQCTACHSLDHSRMAPRSGACSVAMLPGSRDSTIQPRCVAHMLCETPNPSTVGSRARSSSSRVRKWATRYPTRKTAPTSLRF